MLLSLTPITGDPAVVLVNVAAIETVEPLPGERGSIIHFRGRTRTPLQVRQLPESIEGEANGYDE